MSVLKLTAILISAICFVPPAENPSTGEQSTSSIATVAGEYYYGDGLGMNCSLTITQEGRFSFKWQGCEGVNDQNLGAAKIVAGHLILTPERPKVRKGFKGMATDYIPIRWGDRLYLIPEADRGEFCNGVNQGDEPREDPQGDFYMRWGDWEKKVAGLPKVPKEWDRLLLAEPLHGKVIEVLGEGRAKVDLGSDRGVWKDMELWAETEDFGLVQVLEVGARHSIISTKYPDVDKLHFHKGQGVKSRLPVED